MVTFSCAGKYALTSVTSSRYTSYFVEAFAAQVLDSNLTF